MDNCWDYNERPLRAAHGRGPRAGRLPRQGLPDVQDGRAHQGGGDASRSTNRSSACAPTGSTSSSTTRSCATTTRTGSSPRAAPWRPSSRPRRPASCATSASPATRTRASTCRCWRSPHERGFQFDSVQMPLNVMDAHFRSFGHLVLPYLVQNGIAALGMKTFGDGVILKSDAPIKPLEYLHFSPEPAGLGGDHRHREPARPRPGLRGGEDLQADGQGDGGRAAARAASPTRSRASTSCSRPARPSTAPPRTRRGSARTCRA